MSSLKVMGTALYNKYNIDSYKISIVGNPLENNINEHLFCKIILVGKLMYCIPSQYDHIIIIDTDTDIWYKLGRKLGDITHNKKFSTAIRINSDIYCIPYDYPYFVKINTKTGMVNTIGKELIGKHKFSTANFTENIICCIPYKYDKIVTINTTNDEITTISNDNASCINFTADSIVSSIHPEYIYCASENNGIILINAVTQHVIHIKNTKGNYFPPIEIEGNLWYIPKSNKDKGVIITIRAILARAPLLQKIDNNNSDEINTYSNILVSNNKKYIYCIGRNSFNKHIILTIDTDTRNSNVTCFPEYNCVDYADCILVKGSIYHIPNSGSCIFIYDPETNKMEKIFLDANLINKDSFKKIIVIGDCIYCIPYNYYNIVKIDTNTKTVTVIDVLSYATKEYKSFTTCLFNNIKQDYIKEKQIMYTYFQEGI